MAAVKGLVIGMGFLIAVMMGLIVYGFYQKSQNPDFKFFADGGDAPVQTRSAATIEAAKAPARPQTAFGEISLDLAPSAKVVSATASGNRLVVVIARDGMNADLVTVVDMNTGQVLGRVKTAR